MTPLPFDKPCASWSRWREKKVILLLASGKTMMDRGSSENMGLKSKRRTKIKKTFFTVFLLYRRGLTL